MSLLEIYLFSFNFEAFFISIIYSYDTPQGGSIVSATINPCMKVPLEIVAGIFNTFDNNFRIKIDFRKYLKETKHKPPFTLQSIPTTFPCLSQVELRYLR